MDEADFMDEWGTGPGADEEADKQLHLHHGTHH